MTSLWFVAFSLVLAVLFLRGEGLGSAGAEWSALESLKC